jgi:hypothetical protein
VNLSWNIDSVNDIEAGTVGVVVSASGQSVLVRDLFSPSDARALATALIEKADELIAQHDAPEPLRVAEPA